MKKIFLLCIVVSLGFVIHHLNAAPVQDFLHIEKNDKVLGCSDAKNTLVEYSSFGCPHCSVWHTKDFDKFKKKYIDTCKIKYVFRSLPTSKASLIATKLALASKDFFRSMDLVFKTQENWAYSQNYMQNLTEIFQFSGIMSLEEIKKCIDDSQNMQQFSYQLQSGAQRANIRGVPTFFINNKRLQGSLIEKNLISHLN